jgi:uncharacterized protein (DUF885 family)
MKRGLVVAVLVLGLVASACTNQSESSAPESRSSSSSEPTTVASSSPTTPASIDPAADLAVADFATFLEDSYALLAVRRPEALTSAGVAGLYGLGNDRLNDLSPAHLEETQALQSVILSRLGDYDREALSTEDQVSYDLYAWYLDQLVRGHEFAYHDYPLHHFVNSYNTNLLLFLTEEHPMDTLADAEDYVARLSQIDAQVGQLIEGLEIRRDLGNVPPRSILRLTLSSLRDDVSGPADRLALYTTFKERLDGIEGLNEAARLALLDEALVEVETSFVPAWKALISHLESLEPLAGDDPGVWRLPDGDAYYAYLLRDQTSTAMSAEEIHAMGLAEVARVEEELRVVFNALGYPDGASLGELRQQAARDGGSLDGSTPAGRDEVVAAYEALIDEASASVAPHFTAAPNAEVIVVPEQLGRGGFYVPSSVDGSRPGAFHAGVAGNAIPRYVMPTVAYHEAVPGHHFQIALAQELDLPAFRRFTHYNGFVEGWALYAERLAAETGLYEDDPYGDVGRLELELLRAVRLVVDTGIHDLGWSTAEARAYMDATIPGWSHEVERYTVLPGQATGYMVGQQQILEQRDQAAAAFGDDFDLAAFHEVVIGGGSVPLEVLDDLVAAWIAGS